MHRAVIAAGKTHIANRRTDAVFTGISYWHGARNLHRMQAAWRGDGGCKDMRAGTFFLLRLAPGWTLVTGNPSSRVHGTACAVHSHAQSIDELHHPDG